MGCFTVATGTFCTLPRVVFYISLSPKSSGLRSEPFSYGWGQEDSIKVYTSHKSQENLPEITAWREEIQGLAIEMIACSAKQFHFWGTVKVNFGTFKTFRLMCSTLIFVLLICRYICTARSNISTISDSKNDKTMSGKYSKDRFNWSEYSNTVPLRKIFFSLDTSRNKATFIETL